MAYNLHQEYLAALPPDWEKVIIDSLGTIYSGGTPSREQTNFWNGTIPWVTPGEITSLKGKYLTQTQECITEAGLSSSSAQLMPPGTVLVTTRATIGLVAISKIKISTNQGFKSIVPNSITDSNFCYYLLNHIKPEMARLASGSTFDEISRKDFSFITIPRPPVEEQRSIAQILDTIDEAIATTTAHIEKLKLAKAGILHDLLTRGIDENGELRDPIRHPEQFKKSELGLIPSDWKIKKLVELAEINSGVTLGRNVSGLGTMELPYLRVANVQDGYLDLSDIKTVHIFKNELDRYLLKSGDVLMNEVGDFDKLGRGTVWTGEIAPCLHQNHVFRVRPNQEVLLSGFLALVSGSSYGKKFFIMSSKQSTNLASINSSQLKSFSIPCPNRDEQVRILNCFDTANELIQEKENRLQKLKLLKQGLMSDLLTGQVRVQVESTEAS